MQQRLKEVRIRTRFYLKVQQRSKHLIVKGRIFLSYSLITAQLQVARSLIRPKIVATLHPDSVEK